MTDKDLTSLLTKAGTIAIIGAKDTPGLDVDRVGRYLMDAGYTVIPVHPVRKTVWGLPACATLAEVPVPVDIVNLFRASQYCEEHARETLGLARPPLLFWMQLGIVHDGAFRLMEANGIAAVQDSCLMVEHARLFGKTPLHDA